MSGQGRQRLARGEMCVCVLDAQSCPTLCDPMDCSLPGSSVHEILQARVLEWVAIPFSKGKDKSLAKEEGEMRQLEIRN